VWAGVLGSPIAHSLSPVLHRAAYAHLGLTDWRYDARECTADELPGVLDAARGDGTFGGYSLTMPLKVTALALVDGLEPLASAVGAVNTVVRQNGGLYGANTDVPGMVNALGAAGVGSPERPLVLGGGGSAQAAVAALAALGSRDVRVALRSPARAPALQSVARWAGVALEVVEWAPAALAGVDLVISAVPVTASGDVARWVAPDNAGLVLFDLVYSPWPTPLAAAAARAGARIIGGLELLIHQAVGQIELMTGRLVDVDVLRGAGEAALQAR